MRIFDESLKEHLAAVNKDLGAARERLTHYEGQVGRAAGWQVFRQTEVTEPMFGYGDIFCRMALGELPAIIRLRER